jgi:hypothetical protein
LGFASLDKGEELEQRRSPPKTVSPAFEPIDRSRATGDREVCCDSAKRPAKALRNLAQRQGLVPHPEHPGER